MKIKNLLKIFFTAMMLAVLFMPYAVGAQENEPTDDEVNAIAKQLFCPVCENIPLDTCGTVACEQWRGIIRDKLAEGWDEDQIKNYFVEQYGDRVLAEPPPRGFNWVIYIVPIVIFVTGSYLFFKGFQKWQQQDQPPGGRKQAERAAKKTDLSVEDLDRVEKELRDRSEE